MKTLDELVDEEIRKKYDTYVPQHIYAEGFLDAISWLKNNLHLLPTKDLLKHEDVRILINLLHVADSLITKFYNEKDIERWTNLKAILKPFTEGEK